MRHGPHVFDVIAAGRRLALAFALLLPSAGLAETPAPSGQPVVTRGRRVMIAPPLMPRGYGEAPRAESPATPAKPCARRCEGRACGDDGCGGSCGRCPSGRACDERGQCGVCAGGEAPTFDVHVARSFRCYPDPVRGGTWCDAGSTAAEYAGRQACERACRGGAEGCGPGAAGAACTRCVEGCGASRAVPCVAANHGTPEGEGCRIEGGTWGSGESVTVPAACPQSP